MPAVLRALKSRAAQVALCQQLDYRIRAESGKLEHDQYNLVVKLINAALQDESSLSTTMIASALLPLVTAFHRGLAHGVVQFSYTSVQEHAVWNSIAFWEEAFYMEVQNNPEPFLLNRIFKGIRKIFEFELGTSFAFIKHKKAKLISK